MLCSILFLAIPQQRPKEGWIGQRSLYRIHPLVWICRVNSQQSCIGVQGAEVQGKQPYTFEPKSILALVGFQFGSG
jgi:hypothetical protein